ncbi:MAG: radical SAM protein [Deltaproteobacteria bacterium]|nr:radical SAM protein [Deltaproteobacteria bacterium]
MIIFDVTNVCNLACVHCPQPQIKKEEDYRATYLEVGLFRRLIDEIATFPVQLIRFTGDGEPLLHKELVSMISYAKEKNIKTVNLTTNGTLLHKPVIESLLNAKIDVIDISLDAFFKHSYEQVRLGGDYNRVWSNVHQLIYERNRRHAKTKIMLSCINQDPVREEVALFEKYWKPQVDFVLIRNLHTANSLVKTDEGHEELGQVQDRYPCPHLWKRMTIDFAGNVKFCAHDWYAGSIVTHIHDKTIQEIWQGDKYKFFRSCHLKNTYEQIPICNKCMDWASVPWDHGFEKVIEKVTSG